MRKTGYKKKRSDKRINKTGKRSLEIQLCFHAL